MTTPTLDEIGARLDAALHPRGKARRHEPRQRNTPVSADSDQMVVKLLGEVVAELRHVVAELREGNERGRRTEAEIAKRWERAVTMACPDPSGRRQ